MANVIKSLKVKQANGTYGIAIPFGAKAENVTLSDGTTVQTALPSNLRNGTGTGSLRGTNCTSSNSYSTAIGNNTQATGTYSFAEGNSTKAIGNYGAHAEGNATEASGSWSHAEGQGTKASASGAHAEGNGTQALSLCQHVQGQHNITDSNQKYLHIVGNGSVVDGTVSRSNAHTIDWNGNCWYQGNIKIGGSSYDDANAKEIATKDYVTGQVKTYYAGTGLSLSGTTFSSNNSNLSNGSYTASLVQYGNTVSSVRAIAIGYQSTASNTGALAAGAHTTASGLYSVSAGLGTIAKGGYSVVLGKYNIEDTNGTYAHIIGNGTDSVRANISTIDWSGNAWYQGTIKVGGTNYNTGSETVLSTGEIITRSKTLSSGNWSYNSSSGMYTQVVSDSYVSSSDTVLAYIRQTSYATAQDAGMQGCITVGSSQVTFYAMEQPSSSITVDYTIFKGTYKS